MSEHLGPNISWNMIMELDPKLVGKTKDPEPFVLSIEPVNRPVFHHGYHLGTDVRVARDFARELFRRYDADTGQGLFTVALMREGRLFDVYDGDKWASERAMDE